MAAFASSSATPPLLALHSASRRRGSASSESESASASESTCAAAAAASSSASSSSSYTSSRCSSSPPSSRDDSDTCPSSSSSSPSPSPSQSHSGKPHTTLAPSPSPTIPPYLVNDSTMPHDGSAPNSGLAMAAVPIANLTATASDPSRTDVPALPSKMHARAQLTKPKRELTRSQLAQRIANGETLVLRGRTIYKLDSWLSKHPGGELAILHFVGRDARDEIEAYHSDDTLRRMGAFAVAVLAHQDWLGVQRPDGTREGYRPLVPPIQLGYRNGVLEHPEAHNEVWERKMKGHDARDPSVVGAEIETEADVQTENETENETDSIVSSIVSSIASDSGYSDGEGGGAKTKKKASKAKSSTTTTATAAPAALTAPAPATLGVAEKPTHFPVPPSLLEPPPDPDCIDAVRERQISDAYQRLHDDVKRAGLYELRPAGYARECARYFTLGLTAFLLWYYADGRTSWYLGSSFFLGLFWHQLTFTAHDAGHTGITHHHAIDRTIGIFIADFLGGLSIQWWCDSHDVHHLVTNHPEHDPDIQHLPFLAVSPRFLVWQPADEKCDGKEEGTTTTAAATAAPAAFGPTIGLWSSYYRRVVAFDAASRLFLRFQHQVYYLIMSLGRFNLYANSYHFLIFSARRDKWYWLENVGLVVFWVWFGAVLRACPTWPVRIGYILISHIVTSPLHVQIVLSHFAQSSQDLGLTESFASRQIRTTMDVQCSPCLDFVHGGLHMQVTHHLFPRLPRHNLRECRDRFVRPFAEKWGLDYSEYTFTSGNKRVLGTLRDVANQVKILGIVAAAQARGEIDH